MRKVTLIRFGLTAALATIGIAGLSAIGCSGDDNQEPGPKPDASTDATKTDTGTTDTGTTDTGTTDAPSGDADAGPPKEVKLVMAHAAPGVPPVRLCFGTGAAGSVAPLNALPDSLTDGQKAAGAPFPGLYPGTGGPLPKFPVDPTNLVITPYIIFAQAIAGEQAGTDAGEKNCPTLLGSAGTGTAGGGTLTAGKDFVKLAAIPAQSFTPGHTYLLTLLGCVPEAAAPDAGLSSAVCGTDYDGGAPNISVGIATLDNAGTSGKMGLQFAHRSTALEGQFAAAANGVVLGIIAPAPAVDAGPVDASDDADTDAAPADAGPPPTIVIPIAMSKYGGSAILPAQAAQFAGLDKDKTPLGIFIPNPDGGTPPTANILGNPIPLNVLSLLSTGITPTSLGGDGGATIFVDGMNYTVVLLGDPTKPAPGQTGYDGRGLHAIAFPNDPVVPSL